MEADWTIALGAEDPVLVVPWSGGSQVPGLQFLDLRQEPSRIDEIEEARRSPPLHLALLLLNGAASPFWTAKCDIWTTSVERGDAPLDPYEMDAEPGDTPFGSGAYIDLVARESGRFSSFAWHERWVRETTAKLHSLNARAARSELVLRPAEVHGAPGFAVSWFLETCGPTEQAATHQLGETLMRSLPAITDTMETTGE